MGERENLYFSCRKRAAEKYRDDRLNSRTMAAELLGISESSLAHYKLGITPVPQDIVVMMAEIYHAPELLNTYCKRECPIGRFLPIAEKSDGLQAATLNTLCELDDEKLTKIKRRLTDISKDGRVSKDEEKDFRAIMDALDAVTRAISELRLYREGDRK